MKLGVITRRRAASIFAPCLFLHHSTSVRLWGKCSRRHNNSSMHQQSQPNTFAVTVIVVALGRPLYFISFPAAS